MPLGCEWKLAKTHKSHFNTSVLKYLKVTRYNSAFAGGGNPVVFKEKMRYF